MRLKITFLKPEGKIKFPLHYNHLIQGFIYRSLEEIDPSFSEVIHAEGFKVSRGKGLKKFKLFSFSRIIPSSSPKREGDYILFPRTVFLIVCSPVPRILESFAQGIVRPDKVRIGDERLIVKEITIETLKESIQGPILVRTLSPITLRETVRDESGKRKSIFLSPFSKEFGEYISRNLRDKWIALTGEDPSDKTFKITLKSGAKFKKRVVKYKDTIVEAWDGQFILEGSPELLRLALYSGLGERNSQGFGCIEVVKRG